MKRKIIIILISIILIPNIIASNKIDVKLEKCIDGDTADFKLNDEIIKVRFLAIDTPEYRSENNEVDINGEMASNYTCDKLTSTKKIRLEFDSKSDKTDKYGRTLAWVFVDNKLLQEELVERGLARIAYLYGDYKYVENLREKESIAKEKKLGIWGSTSETTSIMTIEQFISLIFCIGLIIITMIIKLIKK